MFFQFLQIITLKMIFFFIFFRKIKTKNPTKVKSSYLNLAIIRLFYVKYQQIANYIPKKKTRNTHYNQHLSTYRFNKKKKRWLNRDKSLMCTQNRVNFILLFFLLLLFFQTKLFFFTSRILVLKCLTIHTHSRILQCHRIFLL